MAVKYSKRSFVINLLLIQLTFLFTASPHYHVEGRSFNKREIPIGIEKVTTAPPVRITTIPTSIASIIESLDSSEHHNTDLPSASLSEAPVTITTTTSTTTASTLITESRSNAITSNLNSFPTKPTRPANRSLYEELKASSSFPSFPTFSSNFMKDDEFRLSSIESEEEPGSLERRFEEDENGFKNNETNVERTFVREGIFDESHLAYSSISSLTTSTTTVAPTTVAHLTETPVTTEASPTKESKSEVVAITSPDIPLPTVSNKKGKYLDLIPHENDDNINYTIPNAAEVWALAGMLNVDKTRKRPQNENKSVVLDTHNGDIDDNLAPVNNNQNNTIKSLLDWMEIEKMSNQNETNLKMENSDEDQQEKLKVNTTKNIVVNELNAENEDPATSENVFTIRVYEASTSTPPVVPHSSTTQTALDNGIEIIDLLNKTHVPISRIDVDIFSKSDEVQEFEDKNVELIDPFQSNGDNSNNEHKTKENLKIMPNAQEINYYFTTTDTPEDFTTEINFEMDEKTTTESPVEGTTSIVDSFTVIGEDEDNNGSGDDIFKRTITEVPPTTTDGSLFVQTTTDLPSTTTMQPKLVTIVTTTEREFITEMTTETVNPAINEIPESTERYNKSTEKTSTTVRFATTTQSILESKDTTIVDFERQSSTIIPNYVEFKPIDTTKNPPEEAQKQVKQNQTIEIIDDDKFKYSTVINIDTFPETTIVPMTEFNPTIVTKSEVTNGAEATTLASELLKNEDDANSSNIILISSLSVVGVIVVGFLAFFLFMKKRQKQLTYGQRCRPVGLDAYSLDNVSVYNSVRRKANALRLSKRSYGNSAFEDPSLQSNVLDYQSLQDFSKNKMSIQDEFKEIPQLSVRVDEVPEGCEEKNRYANVVPYPETRVHLKRLNDDEKTEYINANFVKGPKDNTNYYIATQAPLENTIADFWRMIWEQNSKVIIMATDLTENGVERCSEYIPPSVVLDNTQTFGDYQVTLKGREVKDKYAVSQLHLKNLKTNTWREIMHLWYSWPENGSPTDESSVISLLLEARSCLRTSLPDQLDENSNAENNNNIDNIKDKLSTLEKTKSLQRVQGPLTVHCSPGTGRTGTLIACDIILRQLETPPRKIDIPQIVYSVRRGRASAVRAKDQYEFIYKVANSYAIKLNTVPTET